MGARGREAGGRRKGEKSAEEILNVRDEVTKRRSRLAAAIERTGEAMSSPVLFVALLAAHLLWIAANLPFVPWTPWDPYPFPFLATVASAEAPFLALLILMHQQRQEHVDELRGEVALQVSLQVERETTAMLRMLERIQDRLGVEPEAADPETLDRLRSDLDAHRLLENVRRHLHEDEGDGPTQA